MSVDVARFGGGAPLRGELRVPGDKSMSHRALVVRSPRRRHQHPRRARTRRRRPPHRRGARVLSASRSPALLTRRSRWPAAVSMRSVSRPTCSTAATPGPPCARLPGVLAGRPFLSVLDGDASLRERPMRRVVDPLRAMGATIDGRDDGALAPLSVRGGHLRGDRTQFGCGQRAGEDRVRAGRVAGVGCHDDHRAG